MITTRTHSGGTMRTRVCMALVPIVGGPGNDVYMSHVATDLRVCMHCVSPLPTITEHPDVYSISQSFTFKTVLFSRLHRTLDCLPGNTSSAIKRQQSMRPCDQSVPSLSPPVVIVVSPEYRCRMRKIRCDIIRPSSSQCATRKQECTARPSARVEDVIGPGARTAEIERQMNGLQSAPLSSPPILSHLRGANIAMESAPPLSDSLAQALMDVVVWISISRRVSRMFAESLSTAM